MARKTKEQVVKTREAIINAARIVFYQRGVGGTSLETVAKAANMTRGAIYWHFKDKENLFLAVQMESLISVTEAMEATYRFQYCADPLERIEILLLRFFQIVSDDLDVRMVVETIILRYEKSSGPTKTQQIFRKTVARCLAMLKSSYKEAADLGMLRPDQDPKLMTLDTWAFASGLLYRLLSQEYWFTHQYCSLISSHIALRRCL